MDKKIGEIKRTAAKANPKTKSTRNKPNIVIDDSLRQELELHERELRNRGHIQRKSQDAYERYANQEIFLDDSMVQLN